MSLYLARYHRAGISPPYTTLEPYDIEDYFLSTGIKDDEMLNRIAGADISDIRKIEPDAKDEDIIAFQEYCANKLAEKLAKERGQYLVVGRPDGWTRQVHVKKFNHNTIRYAMLSGWSEDLFTYKYKNERDN